MRRHRIQVAVPCVLALGIAVSGRPSAAWGEAASAADQPALAGLPDTPSRTVAAQAYVEYARALAARLSGRPDEAITHLLAAIQHDPKSFTILRELATIYLAKDDLPKAEEYYLAVLKLSPQDPAAHRGLGQICARTRRAADALTHYQAAVREDPDDIVTRYHLAYLYGSANKLPEQAEQYEAILRLRPYLDRPSRALAEIYQKLPRDIDALRQQAAAAGDRDFIPYFHLAQALILELRAVEAVQTLEKAVQIEPEWEEGIDLIEKLYYAFQNLPQAVDALSRIAQRQPGRPGRWYRLSTLLLEADQFAKAAQALEHVRKTLPKYRDTDYRLALCYVSLSRFEDAIAVGRDYLQRVSGKARNPAIHELLGRAYALTGRIEDARQEVSSLRALRDAATTDATYVELSRSAATVYAAIKSRQDAIAVLEEAQLRDTDDVDLHLDIAALCDEERLDEKAEKILKEVLGKSPANARANNHLGYFYAERNRNLDEAVRLVQKAIEAEPRNWAYLDSLGWAYHKLGRHQDALDKLQEAITIHDDPVVREHLGDVFRAMGDLPKARSNWSRALELDPASGLLREKLKALGDSTP